MAIVRKQDFKVDDNTSFFDNSGLFEAEGIQQIWRRNVAVDSSFGATRPSKKEDDDIA